MSNPAQETHTRAQERWPGTTVAGRGRNWIRHQHPTEPGRFMLDTSIGAIHYGASSDLEIDTAWVPTTGGAFQYQMILNDFNTFARSVFNVGDLFMFQMAGQSLQFDPQRLLWRDENNSTQVIAIKQAVNATVEDDTLKFYGAYGTGIDFEYQNQTTRLSKVITIDQFSRLPAPTVAGQQRWFDAEFSMKLSAGIEFWIDGALWTMQNNQRIQTVNLIEVRNSAGEVLWWFGYPRAWDSNGNETIGQIEVERRGAASNLFITVRVPYEWLASAVYPVYVDPTIDTIVNASADDAYEYAGTVTYVGASALVNVNDRFLGARWDLSIPAGATIDAAHASYYSITADRPIDFTVYVQGADSAAAFAAVSYDISSRTAHATSVLWNNGGVNAGANAYYDTPSLVTPVQGVINRAGWSSGNYLCVYFTERTGGTAGMNIRLWDGDSNNAPRFHIEYTEGGGAGLKPWPILYRMMTG